MKYSLTHYQCPHPKCRQNFFRVNIPGTVEYVASAPRCHYCQSYPSIVRVYDDGFSAATEFAAVFRRRREQMEALSTTQP